MKGNLSHSCVIGWTWMGSYNTKSWRWWRWDWYQYLGCDIRFDIDSRECSFYNRM